MPPAAAAATPRAPVSAFVLPRLASGYAPPLPDAAASPRCQTFRHARLPPGFRRARHYDAAAAAITLRFASRHAAASASAAMMAIFASLTPAAAAPFRHLFYAAIATLIRHYFAFRRRQLSAPLRAADFAYADSATFSRRCRCCLRHDSASATPLSPTYGFRHFSPLFATPLPPGRWRHATATPGRCRCRHFSPPLSRRLAAIIAGCFRHATPMPADASRRRRLRHISPHEFFDAALFSAALIFADALY